MYVVGFCGALANSARALWALNSYARAVSLLNEFCIARVDREIHYIISEIKSGAARKIWVDPHPPIPQLIAVSYGVDYDRSGIDFWDLLTTDVPDNRQLGFSMIWDFLEAAAGMDLSELQFEDVESLYRWLERLANIVQRER